MQCVFLEARTVCHKSEKTLCSLKWRRKISMKEIASAMKISNAKKQSKNGLKTSKIFYSDELGNV